MSDSGRTPEEREAARLARERERLAREAASGRSPKGPRTNAAKSKPSGASPSSQPQATPGVRGDEGRGSDARQSRGRQPRKVQGDARSGRSLSSIRSRSYATDRLQKAREAATARIGARTQAGKLQEPRDPRRSKTLMRRRVAIVVVLAAIVWFLLSLFQPFASDGQERVAVTVPQGAGLGKIADQLHDAGVVESAFFFKLRARLSGATGDFKAGRHLLKSGMSYSAAIEALQASGKSETITITVPEGRSRHEVAELVESLGIKGDYEKATERSSVPKRYGGKANSSLEGFLFPATYEIPPDSTVRRLISEQVKAFQQNFSRVNMSYARKKNLTVFDVVTIASLVEREVSIPGERRLVAAVIYNRLKQGIGLGIDATTRFAVRNWDRPLKQSELDSDSPYNTRKHLGLPPGPIGSPGLSSLKAAARPANVDYLFYVADPCKPGYHRFSKTDAEFQRDVAAYNAAREKAGGKAPEGC